MADISPDQVQVITQLEKSLPELIGTKKEYVEYQEKRYKFAYQLPYSSVNWYKNKNEILAFNIETGVASLLPKREPTSMIDDGLALLRGLIDGEFGDDYDLATVKILMRNFDEVKSAIWDRLTPEEKKKIRQLPKESIRVEKDTLVIDTELPGVVSPIGIDDDLKNIKTINYQGKTFTWYGQGVLVEFADEKETQTILLDILGNKICVCDYLPLPPKRRQQLKKNL